jgi:hypothetical protein
MCGSASGQQAKNIIKLKRAITVKDASYLNAKAFFLEERRTQIVNRR